MADHDINRRLKEAAISGDKNGVKTYLQKGANPNKGNALDYAARGGHMDITKLLLSYGGDPNNGDALRGAAMNGHVDIIQLLLSNGADANNGNALTEAVQFDHIEIVKLLLRHGADPNKLKNLHPSFEKRVTKVHEQVQQQQQYEYSAGIKEAVEKPCNITITVVGHKGVGKSCLVKQLKQESIPEGGPGSTDTADFYVNYIAYNPETSFRKKLDENGEMETCRHRLRQIIGRYRKGETTEEDTPETIYLTSDRTTKHQKGGNNFEEESAQQDRETKDEIKFPRKPVKEPETENEYNDNSNHLSSIASASSLSLMTKMKRTGLRLKQIVSKALFRIRPKVSREQNEIIQEIMRTETKDVKKEVKGFVTIYDFGGEKVFYNTIHCFLSSNMIFIIVIDVEMCLDPENSAAGYEITKQWLRNVATYATDGSATDVRTPAIILVGSHLDKVAADREEQEAAFKRVLDKLQDDPQLREIMNNHVLGEFAIANLNDSTKNKELYEYIWQRVLQIAPLQSQWKKPVPARWVALQHELVRLKHTGVTVLMYEELVDINSRLPVPLKEKEIKPFLLNLKLNGSFHCFDLDGKNPFLILKAQWTIDAFKAVITDPKFASKLSGMLGRQWREYEKSGVLRLDLLLQLWAEEIFFEKKDMLYIVMETLNLLAKPVLEDPDAVAKYYIVPSMLQDADPEVIHPILDVPHTIITVTLCLKFNNPFLPQAVWDKMIASCIHRFELLHEQGHDGLKFIQRGFACLTIDTVWNVIINCKDNAMKVAMFKKAIEDTPEERRGAGVNLLCILEFLLMRILETNHQKHLGYQFYLHNDFRFSSNDQMVKVDDLQKNSSFQCIGLKGKQWIDRNEIYTWFKHPNHKKLKETCDLGELTTKLLERKLTYRDVGRVSKFIGRECRTFFVELELPLETLEQEMEEHRHLAFRSRITKIFIQLVKLNAGIKFATVADAMSQNGMDPTKLVSVIDENRQSVFVDERLPTTWLQKTLFVDDVPLIERYVDVKAYFNLFLELGFQPKDVDDFDDQYKYKSTHEKIKALLKAFITESKPRPTRNAILLAMKECNMDTESLITALINKNV